MSEEEPLCCDSFILTAISPEIKQGEEQLSTISLPLNTLPEVSVLYLVSHNITDTRKNLVKLIDKLFCWFTTFQECLLGHYYTTVVFIGGD